MDSDWDVEIIDEHYHDVVEIDLINSSDEDVVFISEEKASEGLHNLSLDPKLAQIKGEYSDESGGSSANSASTGDANMPDANTEDVGIMDAGVADVNTERTNNDESMVGTHSTHTSSPTANDANTNNAAYEITGLGADAITVATAASESQFSGQGTVDDPVTILEEAVSSARPQDKAFAMRIECTIPGKEVTKTLEWSTNRIFYRLEPEFGRNCVLSFRGKQIQKFMTPFKCSKELKLAPTKVQLKISTERQLKDEQLRMQREADGVSESETDASDAGPGESETSHKFPVTLQGRNGSVRVLVSAETKIEELLRHYLQAKDVDSPKPSARFDGDLVSASETIGDLGIEEDDNLDIYT